MPRLIRTSPRARRGFTLTELMITVVLFGLVMAVLMRVIVRQQKFYRSANEVIDTRTQVRQAMSVLPLDLRGVSSIGADIKAISDSSITVLATYATGVICSISGSEFVLPPENMSRHILTSFSMRARRGDTVMVFNEGMGRGASDDSWSRLRVDTVVTQTSGCASFLNPNGSENGWNRPVVRLTAAVPGGIVPGAAVRFVRPVRYSFYVAGDGRWYLGYAQNINGAWDTPQPLAGPFQPYDDTGTNTNSTSGLRFAYFDQAGNAITTTDSTSRAAIARIDLQFLARGTDVNNIAIASGATFRDSVLVRVAVRNRD